MGEDEPVPEDRFASTMTAAALGAVREARQAVEDARDTGGAATVGAAVLDEMADTLAALAADDACPVRLGAILLDWRDRLGSHALVARALADMDLHPDLAMQMLRRGLDEVLDAAPSRLAELAASGVGSGPAT